MPKRAATDLDTALNEAAAGRRAVEATRHG